MSEICDVVVYCQISTMPASAGKVLPPIEILIPDAQGQMGLLKEKTWPFGFRIDKYEKKAFSLNYLVDITVDPKKVKDIVMLNNDPNVRKREYSADNIWGIHYTFKIPLSIIWRWSHDDFNLRIDYLNGQSRMVKIKLLKK